MRVKKNNWPKLNACSRSNNWDELEFIANKTGAVMGVGSFRPFTLVKAHGRAWTWGLIERVALDRGLYLRQVDYGRCGDSKEWLAKRGLIEGCGKDYYWLQAFINLSVGVNTRTFGPLPIGSCGTLLLGRDHWKTPRIICHGSKVFVPSVNPIWTEKKHIIFSLVISSSLISQSFLFY